MPCLSINLFKRICRLAAYAGRGLVPLAAMLAVMFAQAVPLEAQHQMAGGAGWIEICADGGSYFIQTGQDDNAPRRDCDHCSACLVPASDTQALMAPPMGHSSALMPVRTLHLRNHIVLFTGPEYARPSCRGPPPASELYRMTPTALVSVKDTAGMVQKSWSLSCL